MQFIHEPLNYLQETWNACSNGILYTEHDKWYTGLDGWALAFGTKKNGLDRWALVQLWPRCRQSRWKDNGGGPQHLTYAQGPHVGQLFEKFFGRVQMYDRCCSVRWRLKK